MGIRDEIQNIMSKDPAARSELEVMLCYPGLHAVLLHRLAHSLWNSGSIIPARMISQFNRALTGIEIHPGATLGKRVFIDHGMGVVIGETTVVGDDCIIYQAVTLGAGSDARRGAETRGKKRHPTLGDGVIVGSGAEIQGPIYVGNNVQVASGSIVLKDVPDNSIVVGVPGRVIYHEGKRVREEEVPDPEAAAIKCLQERVTQLERKLDQLSGTSTDAALSDPVDEFLHGAGI
jgi:serine O-acetyltransferase